MTYEEFTTIAKREISTTEYHEVVEPVYNYHPVINDKLTAAKLYDTTCAVCRCSAICAPRLTKSQLLKRRSAKSIARSMNCAFV